MLFLGEYEHTLDQKQRLAIPSELREVLDTKQHGEAFIVAPGANGQLWLWPEKTFAQLSHSLGGSLIGDPSVQDFERLVFSQAARVPLDSAGRIRIPDRLLQKFGLAGSIMILGVRDHLELTEPEAWNASFRTGPESPSRRSWCASPRPSGRLSLPTSRGGPMPSPTSRRAPR